MKPIHKSTVKAQIKRGIPFVGYIAPSNVNSFHIVGGWHIGMAVTFTTMEELNDTVSNFAFYNCVPELGMRIRFWID